MHGSQIRFGVEVECYLPADAQEQHCPRGSHRHGLPVQGVPGGDGWVCTSDSSVSTPPEGYVPCELVSPILCGESGLQSVYDLVTWLRSVDTRVDSHCGLHVHVDATDLSEQDVAAITAAFVRFELAFFGLSAEHAAGRMASRYCKPSPLWEGVPLPTASRYQSLNLTNWAAASPTKRTLEIRVWQGTTNADEVAMAVHMAVSLLASCTEGNRYPAQQLPTCRAAALEFAALLEDPQTAIIPDCTNEDMAAMLLQRCRRADRAIRQAAAA